MLKISEELRNLYKTDYLPYRTAPVNKQTVIHFPEINLTITNENIVTDSFELTESICDGDELKFGSCESAELKLTVANVDQELQGRTFTVKQIVNDIYEMPLGTYTVDSCKRQSDRIFKDIVAYDHMSALDKEVTTWYNNLNYPISVKNMRESLLNYVGLAFEGQTLVNDHVMISKTINPILLLGRDVMALICEFNATFGHITRENKFKCIGLTGIALYPSETLYPADNLYPAEPAEYLGVAGYRDSTYEDYYVKAIDKLVIKQKEEDNGITIGSGTNPYTIQGNFLLYGKSNSELTQIADNIYNAVRMKYYRPHTTNMQGLPYLEVGDSVSIITSNDVIETFIFKRTLSGMQALSDEISASGYEFRQDKVGLNLQLQLLEEKTMDVEDSVVELEKNTEKELTNLQEGLKESKDLINKYLFEGHRYETENATYFFNASTSHDATKFMIVSLGGIGFGTKSVGQSIESAAYATAWDINGNFNASYIRSGIIQGISLYSTGLNDLGFTSTVGISGGAIDLKMADNVLCRITDSGIKATYSDSYGSRTGWLGAGTLTLTYNNSYTNIQGGVIECESVSTPYLSLSGGTLQAKSGTLWIGQNTVKANDIEAFNSIKVGNTNVSLNGHFHQSNSLNANTTGSGNVYVGSVSAASVVYVQTNFQRIGASDLRLKKDIQSGNDKMKDLILSTKVKSYRFKDTTEDNHTHYGVIAQQLESTLLNLGIEDSSFVEEYECRAYKDEGMYAGSTAKRVNYQEFIAPLIYTVQEQQKQINSLLERIEKLESGEANG